MNAAHQYDNSTASLIEIHKDIAIIDSLFFGTI